MLLQYTLNKEETTAYNEGPSAWKHCRAGLRERLKGQRVSVLHPDGYAIDQWDLRNDVVPGFEDEDTIETPASSMREALENYLATL